MAFTVSMGLHQSELSLSASLYFLGSSQALFFYKVSVKLINDTKVQCRPCLSDGEIVEGMSFDS